MEKIQDLEQYKEVMENVRHEIEKVMIGQKEVIEQLLFAVFAGGHALLEGVPGLGKTRLVHTLAQTFHMSFHRIQFTPDLMPADIVGTNILQVEKDKKEFQFQKGSIFAHVILADEINRATPKTQSALLEAMQEHTVSVGANTYPLPKPFFVLATQNPLEQEGTYPLPEAQLDRFLLKIHVPFPTKEELKEIVRKTTSAAPMKLEKVADSKIILEIQQLIREILVADPVLDYAVHLIMATHPENPLANDQVKRYVRAGAGPRGIQAMIHTAKVRAFINGRYNVSFADIEKVALPALRHRILLNFEGEANGIKTDDLLKNILDNMEQQR